MVLFIENDAEILFEQSSQPQVGFGQGCGGKHRIENVVKSEIEIPLKAADIIIAGMKNFLNVLPGKELPEFIQIVEDKRIHQKVRR